MRISLTAIAAATLLLSGCGTLGYQDTNAAVDANPSCEQGSIHPGDPVAPWCERQQAATWTYDDEGKPVDFTGDKDD
jgi:hypothetical protein